MNRFSGNKKSNSRWENKSKSSISPLQPKSLVETTNQFSEDQILPNQFSRLDNPESITQDTSKRSRFSIPNSSHGRFAQKIEPLPIMVDKKIEIGDQFEKILKKISNDIKISLTKIQQLDEKMDEMRREFNDLKSSVSDRSDQTIKTIQDAFFKINNGMESIKQCITDQSHQISQTMKLDELDELGEMSDMTGVCSVSDESCRESNVKNLSEVESSNKTLMEPNNKLSIELREIKHKHSFKPGRSVIKPQPKIPIIPINPGSNQ
jgi:methyl-accepting chemotaxis protein